MRNAILAALMTTALSIGCGGGSGGGLTDSYGTELPGRENTSFGTNCELPYYETLRGTYRGAVLYEVVAADGRELRRCEWTMSVRIEPDSDTFTCQLRAVIRSDLEQSIVLAADDEYAYQCVAESSQRTIREPNDSPDQSALLNITWPVLADFSTTPSVVETGPYFGDGSVDAPFVYLLDGGAAVANAIRFDGDGGLEFLDRGSPSIVLGTLTKELP